MNVITRGKVSVKDYLTSYHLCEVSYYQELSNTFILHSLYWFFSSIKARNTSFLSGHTPRDEEKVLIRFQIFFVVIVG